MKFLFQMMVIITMTGSISAASIQAKTTSDPKLLRKYDIRSIFMHTY